MNNTTFLAIMNYMSELKIAAVTDIDIDIADIFGQKYRIDIDKGDIDPLYYDVFFTDGGYTQTIDQ